MKTNIKIKNNDFKRNYLTNNKMNKNLLEKEKVNKKNKSIIPKTEKKLSRWISKNNKPHHGAKNLKPKNLNTNDIIVLENVNKYVTNGYNNIHILKDINLKIKKGEFVVIYGPSGSGKTTLLTLISALDRATTGLCYLFDVNTTGVSEHGLTVLRRKHVGYIFQQYGLLGDLTVYDNVKIAASLQKDKNKIINIDELLKDVDMYEHKNKKASNLSGGQAQRVAICRAIIKNPKVLFGDEPTGAVHIDATKQILKIFKNINKKFNTTIIIVTHNDKILSIADRIIKVESGKIKVDSYNNNVKNIDDVDW